MDCFNEIEAQRRLLVNSVLIAGYLDPKAAPSSASLTYLPPAVAARIHDAQQRLAVSEVDVVERVLLDAEGSDLSEPQTVSLIRRSFGVEMTREAPGQEAASVFCQLTASPTLFLHVIQLVDGEHASYRLAMPGGTKGTIANLKATVPSHLILSAPYLAELRAAADAPTRKSISASVSQGMAKGVKKIQRSVSVNKQVAQPALPAAAAPSAA